jgi:hypothetical protein
MGWSPLLAPLAVRQKYCARPLVKNLVNKDFRFLQLAGPHQPEQNCASAYHANERFTTGAIRRHSKSHLSSTG